MIRPTATQVRVLRAIHSVCAKQGYGPSFRDLMRVLRVRSSNCIAGHLKALERKGCIVRDSKVARSVRITEVGFREMGAM